MEAKKKNKFFLFFFEIDAIKHDPHALIY